MKKKDLIKAITHIDDDDHIMIGDECFPYVPKITAICGKGQHCMIYHCVLPIGHAGDCYCKIKDVSFTPEQNMLIIYKDQEGHNEITMHKMRTFS